MKTETRAYRHCLLTLSCEVVTEGHTNIKEPATKPRKTSDLFKCVWPFATYRHQP